jgi:hypothetical protein
MGRLVHTLLLIAILPTAIAAGQEDNPTRWFETHWASAASWRPAEPVLIEYSCEVSRDFALANLDGLRRHLARQPGGVTEAQRAMLDKRKRGLETGRDLSVRYRFWFGRDGWRWSKDTSDGGFSDHGMVGGVSWTHSPTVMNVADRRSLARAGGAVATVASAGRVAPLLLFGGLGAYHDLPIAPQPTQATFGPDGSWQGLAVDPTGAEWRFSGERIGDVARVTTLEVHPPRMDGIGDVSVDEFRFHEPHIRPALGLTIPGRIEWLKDGRLFETWTVREVSSVPAGEFADLIAVPRLGGQDPLRGEVSVRLVHDYRPGVNASLTVEAGEVVDSASFGSASDAGGGEWMRPVGWGLAATGALAIVALKCRGLYGADRAQRGS